MNNVDVLGVHVVNQGLEGLRPRRDGQQRKFRGFALDEMRIITNEDGQSGGVVAHTLQDTSDVGVSMAV